MGVFHVGAFHVGAFHVREFHAGAFHVGALHVGTFHLAMFHVGAFHAGGSMWVGSMWVGYIYSTFILHSTHPTFTQGIFVNVYAVKMLYSGESCYVGVANIVLSLCMYSSYFALFCVFFFNTYLNKHEGKAKVCDITL